MHYRVHSEKVKCLRWYPTRAEAIAAFERQCKQAGIRPPERYLTSVSGDAITNNDIAYSRRSSARGLRDGHGWVCIEACNVLIGAGGTCFPGLKD